MTLGERLAFIRKESGQTQKKLAEKTGVSRTTINRIENDAQSPTIQILAALLKGAGSNLGDFFNIDQTDDGIEDLLWKVRSVVEQGGEAATVIGWAVGERGRKSSSKKAEAT